MALLSGSCMDTKLDSVLTSRLFKLINGFSYKNYDLNKEETELFNQRFASKSRITKPSLVNSIHVNSAELRMQTFRSL